MTRSQWMSTLGALAIIITPISASAKVDVVTARSPALAKGSTFAWAPAPTLGVGLPDPAIANEITANRLQEITERSLAGKGYREVRDVSEADFLVSYTVAMLPMSGCSDRPCGEPAPGNLNSTIHTEGMLVLDLTERQTGRLILRATSRKQLTGSDVSEKRLAALLREMTKGLPAH